MKTRFFVRKIANPGEEQYNVSGPFVVVARNPLHAARLVRHKWPAYLSNHVCEETHALEVFPYADENARPFISDHRGRVIPSRARALGSLKNKTLVVDGTKWLVRQAISRAEADHAIAIARCTGSRGSIHTTVFDGAATITAEVERI